MNGAPLKDIMLEFLSYKRKALVGYVRRLIDDAADSDSEDIAQDLVLHLFMPPPKHPGHRYPPFVNLRDRFGCHDDALCDKSGICGFFRRFQEEEGKQAFEAYIKRTEGEVKKVENE